MAKLSNAVLSLTIIGLSVWACLPSAYAEDSQYKGSEAFNQFLSLGETVNQDTGSLNLNPTLLHLAGVNSDIPLTVKLVYQAGGTGNFGLPAGWSFDIPFIVPNKSLSLHGKTYAISPTYQSWDGFKSGLKYSNDEGLTLKTMMPSQTLPGNVPGTYKYLLVNGDGSHYYFDNVGKLRVLADGHGNQIAYYYNNDEKGVVGNYLKKIVDSYGQDVTFGYGFNHLDIGLPDGSQTTLRYDDSGIKQLIDPLKHLTTFSYINNNNTSVVNEIKYPTGLVTVINYGDGATYKGCDGSSGKFPQVSALTHIYQGNLLDKTVYDFASSTGASYTGASGGYCMGGSGDGLMDSNNTHYFYTAKIKQLGPDGHVLTETDTDYNFMHLPVQSRSYLVGSGSGQPSYKRTLYNYGPIADWNKHKLMPAYSQPIATSTAWVDGETNKARNLTRMTQQFDRYAKKTQSAVLVCNSDQCAEYPDTTGWSPIRSQKITYQPNKYGGEVPQIAVTTDEIDHNAMVKNYTLAPDQLSVGILSSTYGPSGAPTKPWKEIDSSYDTAGRMTQEILKWSKGAAPEYETVNASTTKHSYTYDADNHLLTVVTTDPMGKEWTSEANTMLPGAPVVKSTSPSGTATTRDFDALGRLTEEVDPGSANGQTRTVKKVYSLAGNNGAGENGLTTIMPNGYQRKTVYDGQGHEIAAYDNEHKDMKNPCDNGNPDCHPLATDVTASPERLLGSKTYTPLGKLASSSNIEGLTTTSAYDSFGRTISSTDPLGNKTTINYSDQDLTVTKLVNGTKVSMVQLDPIGQQTSETVYPNPDAKDATIDGQAVHNLYKYNTEDDSVYDGFGRVTQKTVYKVPTDGSVKVKLKTLDQTFDPEGKVIESQFTGNDGIQYTRDQSWNLLGKPITYTKTISYPKGVS